MPSRIDIPEDKIGYEMKVMRFCFFGALFVVGFFFLPAFGLLRNALWAFSINTYFPKIFLFGQGAVLIFIIIYFFIVRGRVHLTIPRPTAEIIFGLIFLVLFLILQEAIPLYGDGLLLKNNIAKQTFVTFSEPLSLLIYRAIYLILPLAWKNGALAYQFTNTVAGILAVLAYIKLVHREDKKFQPHFFLLILSLGINVFFFGHIENYTLVYLAMLVYFLLISEPKPRLKTISLILGFSICLHIIALALVPSFIYLVRQEKKQLTKDQAIISLAFFITPMVITFILALMLGLSGREFFEQISTTLMTLKGYSGKSYFVSILSIEHLLDIINVFLLVSPILPVFLILIFIIKDIKKLFDNRAQKLLLAIALPFLGFLIFFDSPLGLARDWDIGSLCSVWSIILLYIMVIRGISQFTTSIRSKFFALTLIAMVLSSSWFIINHIPDFSLMRYKDLLGYRTHLKGTAYGYEILGLYYRDIKEDNVLSAQNWELASKYDPTNWRYWKNAGNAYLKMNKPLNAINCYRMACRFNTDESGIYSKLGQAFNLVGMNDSALLAYKMAYELDPLDIVIQYELGIAYYGNGFYPESILLFEKILASYPDIYDVSLNLIDALIAEQKIARAQSLLDNLESIYGQDQAIKARRHKIQQLKRP